MRRDDEIMIHIRVPLETHKWLAMRRALTRQTMTTTVREALAKVMEKEAEKESTAA